MLYSTQQMAIELQQNIKKSLFPLLKLKLNYLPELVGKLTQAHYVTRYYYILDLTSYGFNASVFFVLCLRDKRFYFYKEQPKFFTLGTSFLLIDLTYICEVKQFQILFLKSLFKAYVIDVQHCTFSKTSKFTKTAMHTDVISFGPAVQFGETQKGKRQGREINQNK